MVVLHKKCDSVLSKNKQLPRNSYLVSYMEEDTQHFDIVQSNSRVEIFNYYYDTYKNVKSISWTDGTVNPKSFDYKVKDKKSKK
jgi:hypothetical protein